MRHHLARVVTGAIAVALGATVNVGVGVVAAPSAHAVTASGYAQEAHQVTNGHRAKRGLVTLRGNACLMRFATQQATLMAKKRSMFHQDLAPILRECGLALVGENVAYGYPSGRAVVNQGWMPSPGHRANILNSRFRQMAVAARMGNNGKWYVAQVFGRRL